MKEWFNIGGSVSQKTSMIIEITGLVVFLLIWYAITYPRESITLQFSGINTKLPVTYTWSGPDKFAGTFDGDNALTRIKPGKYELTLKDSNNCILKGFVNVPENFNSKILDTLTSTCGTKQIKVAYEIERSQDGWISKGVIPPPLKVLGSFKELHFNDFVLRETLFSIKLNVFGYVEAIVLSILIGFMIGLVPFFRSMLSRSVNAVRFIPLTAVTGLFIAWFSIYTNMKVQFLAFGIFVYLMPIVVQRIDEIEKIYLQTAFTLGASKWQMIKDVYWPHVSSKIFDDVRVLTAISWTYIIIAELLNQTGGIGALIFLSSRQSRLDKVFALLIIIVIIGFLQDKLFVWLDKKLFPFKHKK